MTPPMIAAETPAYEAETWVPGLDGRKLEVGLTTGGLMIPGVLVMTEVLTIPGVVTMTTPLEVIVIGPVGLTTVVVALGGVV